MGYPDKESECKMLLNRSTSNPLDHVSCVVTKDELVEMQNKVKQVYVSNEMAQYVVSLVSTTRKHSLVSRGASPRATLSLTDMAKAVAFAENRDYIVPRDVQNIFISTLSHRIILSSEAVSRRLNTEQVLKDILNRVSEPRI